MKRLALLLTALLAASSFAGPLEKKHVSAEAKWLVHLDVENLAATQIGAFLGKAYLDKQLAKPVRDLKDNFDVEFDWRKIRSLTLYGNDFKSSAQETGVIVVDSDLDIGKALDKVIERIRVTQGEGSSPITKSKNSPFPLYTGQDLFGTPVGNNLFLLSKSKEQLTKARQVIAGKAANLTASKAIPSLADAPKGFLVVTVADGFTSSANIPSQAKAFKNAESGRVVAGEKEDKVFLNLALNTKDGESATQMQQMLQGLMALAAMNQGDNKDLQSLVQATKITGSEKMLRIDVELPAADVIAKVNAARKAQKKQDK